jgi:hypothetical protein
MRNSTGKWRHLLVISYAKPIFNDFWALEEMVNQRISSDFKTRTIVFPFAPFFVVKTRKMNVRTIEAGANKSALAKIIGWSLILMAIVAGFSLGYAFSSLYTPQEIDKLKDNVLNNWGLYQQMIIGIGITLALDVVVSYGIYAYFKEDNRNISLASGLLRLIYTFILGIATYFLIQNLVDNNLGNQTINQRFQLFESIWFSGLLLFGVHIILTGYLMKLHRKIPAILWFLTIVAGFSYIIVHIPKLIGLDAEFWVILEIILVLPMMVGELGLAIWLLLRGGR